MNFDELLVMYGDSPEEIIPVLLDEAKIADEIPSGATIGLKPNLVVPKKSETGATTDPRLVSAVIEYLKDYGFHDMVILESSWIGASTARAFKVCGFEDISYKYRIPLIDLKEDGFKEFKVGDLSLKVCSRVLEVDYLINLPVLKAHCQTKLTCALKNLKGCIPDSEKRRFHSLGLHKPVAYLNAVLKSDFIIVDGITGDLTFEEGGSPVHMNRIIAGKDPVLVDSYAARLIGYDENEIEYITIARQIGVGKGNLDTANIIEINKDTTIARGVKASGLVNELSRYVIEKDACSACYGNLINALQRLKEKGMLKRLRQKSIYIGQGFRGKTKSGIGIGSCTRMFCVNLNGCPPYSKDIVDFLAGLIKNSR